jgi:hypothetical protein
MSFAPTVRGSVLLAGIIGVSAAYADGACEKGSRDTTAAERQTMLSALEAARAALPGAPEGWIIGGYEGELSVRQSLCLEDEGGQPWSYGVSRTLNRADDAAERERALAEVGVAARAAQAARQPRMDEFMAKIGALGGELGAAAQRGDQARIAAINVEMEKLQKEFEAFMAQGDDQALIEATARATMQDRIMTIDVRVNEGVANKPDDAQSAAAPAGAHSAYRWVTTADGVETAHALVLFGSWRAEGGGVELQKRATSVAAPHGLAVHAEADPGRLESLLASIDFAAIAALAR